LIRSLSKNAQLSADRLRQSCAEGGNAGGSKTRSGFEPRTSPVPPQPPVEQAVDESSDHGFRIIPLAHLLVTAKIPTGAGQCREAQAHRIQCRQVSIVPRRSYSATSMPLSYASPR